MLAFLSLTFKEQQHRSHAVEGATKAKKGFGEEMERCRFIRVTCATPALAAKSRLGR